MEPLFWILVIGFGGCFGIAIVAGIIMAIVSSISIQGYTNKYIEKGIITKKQKKQLPSILVEKGKKEMDAGNVSKAISYFNDCIAMGKFDESLKKEKDNASVELARYYNTTGAYAKALELVENISSSQVYLLRGEILLKRNKDSDYDNIIRYLKRALESEETKDKAQKLLLEVGELLLKRNKSGDYEEAVKCAQMAMECKEIKDRAQKLVGNVEVTKKENAREQARQRFETAIKKLPNLNRNPGVTIARHTESLGYWLDWYHDIVGYADAQQRKQYSKELSVLAYEIAFTCCQVGLRGYGYAYLQKEDKVIMPQKDYLYAVMYARTKFGGELVSCPTSLVESYKKKLGEKGLEIPEFPRRNFQMALDYAERAYKNGIKEAYSLINQIKSEQEQEEKQRQYQETLDKIQKLWDKEFEKKYGMSRDEYEEEQQQSASQRRQREAELANQKNTRRQKMERDMDISEMLQDKRSGGSGKSMKEKWETGEISTQEYLEHQNKRNQHVNNRL